MEGRSNKEQRKKQLCVKCKKPTTAKAHKLEGVKLL